MIRVCVESPLAGDMERNIRYAQACIKDCLNRGEAPYASHLLYPQVLDDTNPAERALGMQAGFAWAERANLRAVYLDLGVSKGMRDGIKEAERIDQEVEMRTLGDDWDG